MYDIKCTMLENACMCVCFMYTFSCPYWETKIHFLWMPSKTWNPGHRLHFTCLISYSRSVMNAPIAIYSVAPSLSLPSFLSLWEWEKKKKYSDVRMTRNKKLKKKIHRLLIAHRLNSKSNVDATSMLDIYANSCSYGERDDIGISARIQNVSI